MRMNFDMVCKKASLLLNVNTLVGNDCTNSIFIYQTWIFCKKIGSNRSFLPEIGAQTFCYIPGGVATAYSTDKNPNVNKLSRAINYGYINLSIVIIANPANVNIINIAIS